MPNSSDCRTSNKPITASLFRDNPVFVMLLGLCPALAVSDTVRSGLGISIATFIVLVLSSTAVSLAKGVIPKENRVVCIAFIIALFTSIIDIAMRIYQPQLHASLGIFVPLIAVNCLLYQRAIYIAAQSSIIRSVKDAVGVGAGYMIALLTISSVREILGHGTFLGYAVFGGGYQQQPIIFISLPAGAFLVFALLKLGFYSYSKKKKQ